MMYAGLPDTYGSFFKYMLQENKFLNARKLAECSMLSALSNPESLQYRSRFHFALN